MARNKSQLSLSKFFHIHPSLYFHIIPRYISPSAEIALLNNLRIRKTFAMGVFDFLSVFLAYFPYFEKINGGL
jgi:hypothetical protein